MLQKPRAAAQDRLVAMVAPNHRIRNWRLRQREGDAIDRGRVPPDVTTCQN